jgi:LytR cell envelope-related transcriptional attenuator
VVQRGGSTYLTPEADVVKTLLTTTSGETAITVEVQNGSGVIGVAEQAMTLLKPLGYDISAAGNSDDFPGVEQTRVEVHPGGTEVGALVRALLGTGAVTESDAVEPGHVLVVLGKDYNPTPSSTSGAGVAGASRIWG